MSQTREQKCFTISEVAVDWHKLMIPQRTTVCGHPLLASANNWTRGLQLADIPPPQSATLGVHPVARKLLLISRPAEGRRLSWPVRSVCHVFEADVLPSSAQPSTSTSVHYVMWRLLQPQTSKNRLTASPSATALPAILSSRDRSIVAIVS